MGKLIPRLNYNFGFKDFLFSVQGLFRSKIDMKFLNAIFETEEVYFVNHARSGLRLLLNSLSLPAQARIGVQAYNCHTVFNAITHAGYQPLFIDIDADLRMDTADLERKKNSIDALIVTHTFGIPADMDGIKRVLPGKPIIEDCAHAFLSRVNEKLVGKSGHAAVFSVGKGKFPSIGSGGFVVINDKRLSGEFKRQFARLQSPSRLEEMANILKSIILHIAHKPVFYGCLTDRSLRWLNRKIDFTGKCDQKEKRMLKSTLYLLSKTLDRCEAYKRKQQSNCRALRSALPARLATSIRPGLSSSWNGFMFPVQTENAARLASDFKIAGIELGRHFSKSIEWAQGCGYESGSCPTAETTAMNILVFPCHAHFKDTYFKKMVSQIESLD